MKYTLRFGMAFWLMMTLGLLLIAPVPPPARSQDPAPQTIESNDARVARSGNWTSQAAADASGGSYLFNSPSPLGGEGSGVGTALQLEFYGPSLEIIYIAGPSLGTLAINIDDTVLRTVITTAETTAYQQVSRINYLSDEPHILKVYAQAGGVVAIDAFIIPTPSPSPLSGEGEADGEARATTCAPINTIHRVSLTNTGGPSDGESLSPRMSVDGRYVTFYTLGQLVNADTNAAYDVYVYDRQTCTLEALSVNLTGGLSGGQSPSISADGRYVAFHSNATDLVSGDTNGGLDVFVFDRLTDTLTRVSVATGGTQATGGGSSSPAISADGRYVTFYSFATDLVANDTNGQADIFVHDRTGNTTTRVSVATGGGQSIGSSTYPAISADGRYVAFFSDAVNLVSGDTNGQFDVFVHDRDTTTTTRVSVATGGTQATGGTSADPALSADGRYVVFESAATNLVGNDTNMAYDVFVHDRQTAITTRVSVASDGTQADTGAWNSAISGDGRYVAFYAESANLVSGDTNSQPDIFVHDRNTAITTRVSVGVGGIQASGGGSNAPAISADGGYVAFDSEATNLVNGDTNGLRDIFVTPRIQPSPDSLALFNPPFQFVSLLNGLTDTPPASAYTAFSAYAPVNNGQWVMGDWNADGLDTPGLYLNGVFYFTNVSGESLPADWGGFWIGVNGPPVAGRFSNAGANDCVGVVDGVPIGGVTIFALYYTCDMSGVSATPPLSFQWLSAPLPNPTFAGTFQFSAGDFNGDGLDSIAVRRNEFIAYGNVNPAAGPAVFDLAQYIGAPGTGDNGLFVVGDWDGSGADSFGLFYQNGELFYRNDLDFNTGVYVNQSIGAPFGNSGIQVATWR